MLIRSHTILYVDDQARATIFYAKVLGQEPNLNVPGMTEFHLSADHVLGLMPEAGIKRLLGEALPDPARGAGIPRAELYLIVDDPQAYFDRALTAGAESLSPLRERDWGHQVAYCFDRDSHVLAFAKDSAL